MKKKQFRLHPALLFLVLTFIIMIISSIGGILNIDTNYYNVNPATGNLESNAVIINNLFNRTGIQYLISNMLSNFINFAPLGNLIIGLLGVGVAYKSGYLTALFNVLANKIPKKVLTFLVVLLGIFSSMFFEAGYVILIPLSAILFLNLGRHPSAGICASFAGITFGYGANIFITGIDSTLSKYTQIATTILDKTYKVNINGNIYFTLITSFLLAYLGMIVTEKIIIPKLGKYNFDDEEIIANRKLSSKEKKGVSLALIATFIISIFIIYSIIPGLPFSGLLLDLNEKLYVNQLFGENSYFNKGVVFITSSLLVISGLIYGLRVKTIKNNKDLVDGMSYYIKDVASILVLIFFAAQFCLIFKHTNIGMFVVASLAEILNSIKLSGLLLIVVSFIFVAISTIFVPSIAPKWAILSPIMVPMFMQSSLTPEFSQAVFRAADSAVKGVTPFFSYFILFIGFLQIYDKKKNDIISLTDAISLMVPYALIYLALWFIMILAFYIIGIPIGFNTGVML